MGADLFHPAARTRKVRSDKGTRKPHPSTCRHCVMVDEYRLQRHVELDLVENHGGWRDETWRQRIITFRKWLIHYRYEQEEAA